jgi:hypothetical protein
MYIYIAKASFIFNFNPPTHPHPQASSDIDGNQQNMLEDDLTGR